MILVLLSCANLFAQQKSITISGKLLTKDLKPLPPNSMVVNQRTESGVFLNGTNKFSITAYKSDTILISTQGYSVYKLCFNDSLPRDNYNVVVIADSLSFRLHEVVIKPIKNLDEINEEERKLGFIPNTDINKTTNPVDVLSILFLNIDIDYIWEYYSHKERAKRKVAQMENDDLRRTILKDYLMLCSKYDLIPLSPEKFDAFVDYCHFTDKFIKTTTEYDLLSTMKDKFDEFEKNETASSLNTIHQ